MDRSDYFVATAVTRRPLRSVRPFLALWAAAVLLCLAANAFGAAHFVKSYAGVADSLLAPHHEKWVRLTAWLLPGLSALAVAALVLGARRRGPAALMSISLLMLSATNLLGEEAWFLLGVPLPLFHIIAGTAWTGITLTFMTFPNGVLGRRWIRRVAFAAVAVHLSIVAYQVVILSPQSALYYYYVPDFARSALLLLAAAVLASRLSDAADLKERQQIRAGLTTLLVSVLLFVCYAALNLGASLFLEGGVRTTVMRFAAWLLVSSFAVLSLGFLVAVLRYGLYDAGTILSRSSAFALLTSVWAVLLAVAEVALKALSSDGGALISVVVAAAIVMPLKNAVTTWTDRKFRQPLTLLRERLPASMAELRPIASLQELLAEAVALIDAALKPVRVAVVVGDKVPASRNAGDEAIARWRTEPQGAGELFALHVPLRVSAASEIDPLGWLLIGPRLDGSEYAPDELAALGECAAPIARAIRTVELREDAAGLRGKADVAGPQGESAGSNVSRRAARPRRARSAA